MKEKLNFNVIPLFIIYCSFLLTLVFSGAANVYNASVLLYVLLCSGITGAAIIPKRLNGYLLPVSHGFLSVFVGAFMLSFAIFITCNIAVLLFIFTIAAIISLYVNRKSISISYKMSLTDIVAVVITLLLFTLISGDDFVSEFSASQGNIGYSDPYFFTSVVSTIRHGSLTNAVYETGSPVIYQDFGFFVPGMLAAVLKITSHQALWGLAHPFYKVMAILFAYDFFYVFFKDKVRKNDYLFMLAALCFPLLLAPLHPLYLAKLNVANFIFSGMGYLLPAGTITYPTSILLIMVSIITFYSCDWTSNKGWQEKLFFSVSVALISIAKLPMYVAFVSFMFAAVLYRVIVNKENVFRYLPYGLLSVGISIIAFKLCMGYPSVGRSSIRYGYLTEYFSELYKRSNAGLKNNMIVLAFILLTYLVLLGIRLLGLVGMLKAKGSRFAGFFTGAVFSLFCSTVIALFVRSGYYDTQGNLLRDGTFDVQQFIRSSFYVITLISGIGLFYFIIYSEKKIYRNSVAVLSALWCLTAFTTLATKKAEKATPPFAWYTDNLALLKSGRLDDGLIVINPRVCPYGIMLSSSDYGRYWTAMGQAVGCYNGYSKNEYRWDMYARFLALPTSQLLDSMKIEGVRYIIAIPPDKAQVVQTAALFPERLKKLHGSDWVYVLQ